MNKTLLSILLCAATAAPAVADEIISIDSTDTNATA